MSGKCRPCLREKTLANLYAAWCRGNISATDYSCVVAVFKKLDEYEKREDKSNER